LLVFAPRGRNGELLDTVLSSAGFGVTVFDDLKSLCADLSERTGAIIVTEDALTATSLTYLVEALERQPPWSDVPLIILTSGGVTTRATTYLAETLGRGGNFTLLERPVRMLTLVVAVRSALKTRRRQFQVKDLLASESAARAEAERASRLKDEFLSTLSHELRTPLNAIVGWAHLLKRGRVDAEQLAEGVNAIARNANVQKQLVDDLLDLSRIISGKLVLNVRTIDLAEVISAAVESVAPAANAKGIRVEVTTDRTASVVSGDAARLQQVFWNLLVNAAKFTPPGGEIRVTSRREGPRVIVQVADTGEGISPDFLPYVFERFRQADAATTRRHGGLGIGLALVKQLTELHGGSVRVQSEGVGKGATFAVELPALAAADQTAGAATEGVGALARVNLKGVRVLVVDDDADAATIAARMLQQCGAEVTTASSAPEALNALTKERPDVLLSDIGMPGMDGHELIRRVRSLPPDQGGRTPAAAFTALARSEDRSRALRSGFQSHVPKPMDPDELVTVVASLAGRTG
jgi:signal transduction histidine kinase/CheY-like chemotaxis protein